MDKAESRAPNTTVQEVRLGDLVYVTVAASGSAPETAYRAAADVLAAQDATPVLERVFGSLSCRDEVLAARQSELGRIQDPARWPVTYIQGNPPGTAGLAGLHLIAAVGEPPEPPRDGGRVVGAVVEQGDIRRVFLGDIRSPHADPDPVQQACDMYSEAVRLLQCSRSDFRHVVRTWIYLSDILSWYGEFNEVRTGAFREQGLIGETSDGRVPASTGIEGTPPEGSLCAMDLIAIEGPGVSVQPLHSPRQCGAPEYGSMFSRAMLVSEPAGETVYVSGTASIDEEGRSVYLDDLDGQVRHTLAVVDALIGQVGLSVRDVTGATVFLKRGCDVDVARGVLDEVAPNLREAVLVEADVCRDDLLFEVDGMAVRPRT